MRPTTKGPESEKSSFGSGVPGTIGTFAALIPRFARYMHVGVFDVRDTPTSTTSASFRPQAD